MKISSLVFGLVGMYLLVQSIYFVVAMVNGFVMTTSTLTDIFAIVIMTLSGVALLTVSFATQVLDK